MKLNMMVVMTMCCRAWPADSAGMNAQSAPHRRRGDDREREGQPPGQETASEGRQTAPRRAGDIGLALAADVEQPAWKATATARPVKMKLVA
jgi:hypothetical protein